MEKFGMSFGGGPSRKELLEAVECQKKQLVQYQTRFKDVVCAYKSLLKEKEALEACLKVLSVSQVVDQNRERCDEAVVLQEDGEDGVEVSVESAEPSEEVTEEDAGEPGGLTRLEEKAVESDKMGAEQHQATPTHNVEAERRIMQLKTQLSTLTSALATVTREKSRMEASFQADKRQLKQEVEELQDRLLAVTAQQEAELRALQQQLAESRARVITQQHEREQEQSDQLQQLQELQKILQQERDLRQDAELRLHEANTAALAASHATDRRSEFEVHLNQVREERDDLRRKLQAAKEEQEKEDPRLEQLQQELGKLKQHLQDQIHNETNKANQEEERARECAHDAELRVAGLEQRVSELSDLLGSCEKARQRDRQAAQTLRERIAQLDTENKTLALAASSRSAYDLSLDDSQLDVTALKEKLEKVKKLLLAAQRNSHQMLNGKAESEAEPGEDAATYQLTLRHLKDELERYKLRALATSKSKNAKDGCHARELEEVRERLVELREKYINLRVDGDKAAATHRHQLEQHQQHMAALLHSHRQEVERNETVHHKELLSLEAKLHKQRERTMALLDEKDQELERLKAAALTRDPLVQSTGSAGKTEENSRVEEGETDSISQALWRATPTEPTLLLYAEQLARKEVEAGTLRRHKRQLEEDIHQLHGKLLANAERHDNETHELRAQMDKLIRDHKREGSNMEYLKNVIFKFLTLQDASGRQQTLNAILSILHFSPQEKHAVLRQQGGSWWSANKR
ncbi:GRIP and coiled-coil domain-containing protein 1 [Dunckerocampus dactyliophorus]|uniref:GRIP and coiled-coil domain-containing protein 1 n=1 Tax=Dunckerocampus dactyliophorus TaxID=161453 RepID=UPI002404CAFC|nr:GRIP and coiled-coil domain-containing protein 1 [Dunckerocampus dactyliophorus]XP_054623452.1 GRIP and coiled-coil domain-containing protein 1 [Dunckerocampus dactyliophorus]